MVVSSIAEHEILRRGFGVAVEVPRREPRLSQATRYLAVRYLAGDFGRAMRPANFAPASESYASLSPRDRHLLVVRLIAEQAPLRILPGELLAGAATLLEATWHRMPAVEIGGTSHTTVGFERVLGIGYAGVRREIEARLARGGLDERGRGVLEGMLDCLASASTWHRRHVEALEALAAGSAGDERRHYDEVLAALRPVPENPPANFREALQSLWFQWTFLRLCGNWSGLGRLDKILGPYLERDLADGRLTLGEARELLAHFWIKGTEWVGANWPHKPTGGDAQFYQNVVLGGAGADGREVANALTYLVLDVVEELHISDYPVAVRVGPRTPDRLWRRIAEVQRLGGGIVSIYNEDLIVGALTGFGYAPEDARDFANDGCWEAIVPGRTAFSYLPFDMLQILQETLGLNDPAQPAPCFAGFEALYADFRARLAAHVEAVQTDIDRSWLDPNDQTVLLSLFFEDCIETARTYAARGPRYSVQSIHAGGLPDVANSLLVLKRAVYDERRLTLPEFVAVLRADWAGREPLRLELAERYELYGNGNAEADAMARRVYDDFAALVGAVRERAGVWRPAGISTFGREVSAFLGHRQATPFGRRAHDILAPNLAPTPGTERHGPTAVIGSYCGFDFRKLPNGAPLDLKFLPSSLRGEAGVRALEALLRAFVDEGGWYLQVDAIDAATLRDAQAHPDRYPNLSVRVSGWSARFATLAPEWQEMIVRRTEHAL